jgi:excisionase family DNA binding protein
LSFFRIPHVSIESRLKHLQEAFFMTAPNWQPAGIAAEYLGVALTTLAKWRISGEGPRYARVGKRVLYRRDDLDAWMMDQRVSSTAETPSHRRPNAGRKRSARAPEVA